MRIFFLAHVGAAALLAWLLARSRGRRFSWPDFLLGLLLPGAGPLALAVQAVLEANFRRTVRPASAEELFEDVEEGTEGPVAGPIDDLRVGLDVEPFEDVLKGGDAVALELILQRLARSETPEAIGRLKEALRAPDRDLRVRSRAILARMEDRLVRILRRSGSALERARAGRSLALISPDGPTARLHLQRACRELQSALGPSENPELTLELGRMLLESGDPRRAREVLGVHLRRAPRDRRGVALRMEASLALADREAFFRDAAAMREVRA